jgi:hypothetical protein
MKAFIAVALHAAAGSAAAIATPQDALIDSTLYDPDPGAVTAARAAP